MNAARILSEVKKAGVEVRLSGDNLLLKAGSKPSPELIAHIRAAKCEIVSLLKKEAYVARVPAPFSRESPEGSAALESLSPAPAPPAVVAPLEQRRAAVEALRDTMAADDAARREWWRTPVEGWREGRLVIRSALTGDATPIELRQRRSSK